MVFLITVLTKNIIIKRLVILINNMKYVLKINTHNFDQMPCLLMFVNTYLFRQFFNFKEDLVLALTVLKIKQYMLIVFVSLLKSIT